MALFFHLFFRALAIVVYIVPFVHRNNYVISFVVIIMLLAFDFWTVKNISGRLLVGLRWWNEINEDGTNSWLFESKEVCFNKYMFISFLFIYMESIWNPYIYIYFYLFLLILNKYYFYRYIIII